MTPLRRVAVGAALTAILATSGVMDVSVAQAATAVCTLKAHAGQKNLVGCDLRNVDLHGADLRNVNLSGAQLQGANLREANLSGATMLLANVVNTDFTGANLTRVIANGLAAGRSGESRTTFEKANLSRAVLTGANLRWADLSQTDLSYATITRVVFGNSPDGGLRAHHVIGTPSSLNFGWQLREGFIVGRGMDFSDTDLSGLDFSGLDLTYSTFEDATLIGTDLESTRLDSSSLHGALLDRVDLSGAWVKDADLAEAVLVNSDVSDCDFRSAFGQQPPLSEGLRTSGLTGTARIPTQWRQLDGRFLGPSLIVRDADLAGVDLRGVDLSGISIASSDLSGADLRSASLHWATLRSNDLTGTRLAGVDARRLASDGNTGRPASLPNDWIMRSGILIGPEADLGSVDAREANLRNVQFRDVLLGNADISGADVSGANFAGAWVHGLRAVNLVGTPASLPGAGWAIHGRTMATGPERLDDLVSRAARGSVLTTWVPTWAGGADTESVTVTAYSTRLGSTVAWRCVANGMPGAPPTVCQRDAVATGRYWVVARQTSTAGLVSAPTERVRVDV